MYSGQVDYFLLFRNVSVIIAHQKNSLHFLSLSNNIKNQFQFDQSLLCRETIGNQS